MSIQQRASSMVPLAAVDLGRWFGLSEAQNALAEDLAKNLWVKYKPLRKLVRFVCRVGNAHKVMILGGCAAGAAMWVRGAAQEALMERFEERLVCCTTNPDSLATIAAVTCIGGLMIPMAQRR